MGLTSCRVLICATALAVVVSASTAQAALVYGLTDENDLIAFDHLDPNTLTFGAQIQGLATNDDLVGIDFRPADNMLYGVGKQGRVYTIAINPTIPNTATATQISMLTVALHGSRFGFDFNPVVDRLRIVSDLDQSLAVNVTTGATTVNGPLNYPGGTPNPNVTAAAYTNSFGPSPRNGPSQPTGPGTTLYDIDVRGTGDQLVTQNTASGLLTPVGPLLVNAGSLNGFDIFGTANDAIAALQLSGDGRTRLFSINLTTGTASPIISPGLGGTNEIGGGDELDGIAVLIPEPATVSLAGLALAGALLRRRAR